MKYNFNASQNLVIELTSGEVVEGEYSGGSENRIELTNVSVYPSQQKVKGPLSYYRCEISTVHVHKETKNTVENGEIDYKSSNANCTAAKVITIKQAEYERLKSMSQNFIYMSTIDSRYYSAAEHISNCENVGILCITTSSGKMAKLSLLVVSTWDQVYIFDILLFNQKHLPSELKYMFQSELIKKVMHDSRLTVDLFRTCYKIKIQNIFDTQVADILVRKQKNEGKLPADAKNISECLVEYFNFPTMLLDRAQMTELKKFETRPLSTSRQYRASQLATYLITLKNHLEATLLEELYKAIDLHSKSLLHCSVIESQNKIKTTKLTDMFNDLELKQLSPEVNGV